MGERLRRAKAGLVAAAMVAGTAAVMAWQAAPAHAAPGDGTLTVRVVRDVAGNGTEDAATDFGINAVRFAVADAAGATVTGTTGSDGSAVVDLSGLTGGRYRVQATPPAGSNLQASPTRTGAGALSSLDAYVDVTGGANRTVTMGMWDPTEYCQSNPDLVTCGVAGTTTVGVSTVDKTGVARFSSTLAATIPGVAQTQLTRSQDQGAVYGLGTDRSGNVFLGTAVKRHSAYGPAGPVNAIYRTNTAATNTVSTFVTLPGILPLHDTNLLHDDAIANFVGNAGLGGVTVSGDGKTLYAVDLNDSRLYSIPILGSGAAVSAGSPTSVPIPRPASGCAGTWHPYGLGRRGMTIYVGGTCGAENTVTAQLPYGDPSQVNAYVYQVTGTVAGGNAAFNQLWQQSMDYVRGCSYYNGTAHCIPGTGSAAVGQAGSAHWQAWNQHDPTANFFGSFETAPQPIVGSIAVTANGSLVVGFKDRFADLQGNGTYALGAASGTSVVTAINAGDVLRVCLANGAYTTENNGSCGGATGAGVGNSQGPGGGSYYNDTWTDGPGFHNQTSEGAVFAYSASTDIWSTRIDPFNGSAFKQGVGQYATTGANIGGQEVFATAGGDPTGFGKGSGLAALQALCTSAPVQLGNRVWFDANRNGVQDANELPIPGVTVKLFPAVGATAIASTTTSADGQYYFGAADGVTANTTYRVQFDYSTADTSTLPNVSTTQLSYTTTKANGVSDRINSDPTVTTGSLAVATVTTGDSGVVNHDVDAGLVVNDTIGDFVFFDRNRNGVQDPTDPGIAGVRVHLLDTSGNEVQAATTDASGKYLFTNVPDGSYQVKFDLDPANLPARYQGFVLAPAGAGSDRALDSNPDPGTYLAPVTVGPNNRVDLTIDAGIQAQDGVIGNFVWKDTNGNGVQDPGEPGIPGVTVALLDANGNVVAQTVTVNDERGNGYYLFSGLSTDDGSGSATYRVRFSLAANQLPAAVNDYTVSPYHAAAGTAATDSDANPADTYTSQNVVLTPTTRANLNIDAGLVPPPNSLGDFVWADLNGNGIQDANEPGIAGVTVRLYDAATGNVVGTTSTSTDGRYTFNNLADGSYYVIVDRTTLPAAYADNVFTKRSANGTGQNDSEVGADGRSNTVVVGTNARAFDNLDAGLVAPPNSVGDFIWNDRNGNGIQDAGEPGIQGVTVGLLDSFGKPVLDGNGKQITAKTDANGAYDFTGIPDGTYEVQVDLTSLPPSVGDFVPTVANAGSDNNKDSDLGVTGISAPVSVGVGARSNQTVDGGLAAPRGTLGDYVFYDRNRNNVQDAGDTGVPGVTVTLLDGNGVPVDGNGDGTIDRSTTDGTGHYLFTDLAPGTYGVQFGLGSKLPDAVRDWTAVTPNVGGNNAADSDADPSTGITPPVTLGVNTRNNTTLDLGLVPPRNALGDFVWYDANRNGIQDAGEPGIDGVTVELLDPSGAVTDTTTTANGGRYRFPDVLPDGQYKIHFRTDNLPAPYTDFVFTTPNAGTDTTVDSDAAVATGTTPAVTLGVGSRNNQTLDAGLIAPFDVLGDFVWNDLNGNGVQDAGEPGIPGVKVNLLDGAGTVVDSTTTGPNGEYMFANLDDGTYSVKIDLTTLPANAADFTPTVPNAGNNPAKDSNLDATGGSSQVTLGAGSRSNLTLDLGLIAPANSIGDYVWHDLNGNGVRDSGEPGLTGVTVELLDTRGNVVLTTVTDANGAYRFANVADGSYSVRFRSDNLPVAYADYTLTKQGAGTNDAVDSDANPTTGQTRTVTVGVGSRSVPTLAAGFVSPTNSLGDFVFIDRNGDGVQQPTEPGVAGVTANLVDTNGTVVATTTTDAAGKYLFAGLADGTYSVRFDIANLPAPVRDYTVTTQHAGADLTLDSDADPATGDTQQVTLGTGARRILSLDLGLVRPPNSIGDFVWNDRNGNGVQDANEPGIDGVTVELLKAGAVVATTTTANGGAYSFANIPDGTYTVRVRTDNLPAAFADFALTTQGAGADPAKDSDADPATGTTAPVTVGVGSRTVASVDAGLVAPVNRIGDYVWFDRNRNGVQDPSETGLDGITVDLVSTGNVVVATTVTANGGAYAFAGFPDGSYQVHVHTDNLPTAYADYQLTTQKTGTDRAVDSDPDPASGLTPVVTVGVGNRSVQTIDAGFVAPVNQLGDFVWIDSNHNGVQDAGEPGVAGVTVQVLQGTTVVGTTTTNAIGRYDFTDLNDGTYSVRFDLANLPASVADYTATTQNAGADGTVDSDANPATGQTAAVVLGAGARSNLNLDLGLVAPVNSIGDFVWIDSNHNGVQDSGEPGVAGVAVQLLQGTTVVGTTTTGVDGKYTFSGIADGTYSVRFDVAHLPAAVADYSPTTARVGTNDAVDSDAVVTTGQTRAVTVGVGARSNPNLDLGLVAPVNSIGDFVWADTNHNGIQDAGEPGIPGVRVNLLDAAGKPVDANGDGLPDTTITDGNGKYSFADLPDGTYRISLDPSTLTGQYAGWVPTIQNAGSNTALDSDLDRNTGISAAVTVGTGNRVVPTLDAGVVPSNSISGTVYRDANRDGIRNPDEPGVPCATVKLINTAGAVVATTRTDSDGVYQFVGVPDGTYTVRINTSTACGLPTGSTIEGTPGATTTTLPPITVGPADPTATPAAVPVLTPPVIKPPTTTPPTTEPSPTPITSPSGIEGGSANGSSTGSGTNSGAGTPASTGVDVLTMLSLATLLFGAGLVLLAAARRRRKITS